MIGPLQMTQLLVNNVPTLPGAYALGNNENRALYVGRADASLRAQLLAHFQPAGTGGGVPVHRFWYETTNNALEAYFTECRWYHEFAPTHNAGHPARMLGALIGCPICGR